MDPAELPDPLATGIALASVRNVAGALVPTQGRFATDQGHTGRLLAPDGRYEHAPLRRVDVDTADILVLKATARVLGDPAAPDAVRDGLENGRAKATSTAAELAAYAARLAALLDQADDADATMLRDRLADVDPAADVVLTHEEEAAYQKTADRLNAAWQGGGLGRLLY
ncbi:hypothetical protein [Nonomuraea insulae]|uniref:Uncharacterized protein n=1 Tax=Nonomuraea insulae TaxID=1616787 RepID=A0ABW1D6W8_9ACTN